MLKGAWGEKIKGPKGPKVAAVGAAEAGCNVSEPEPRTQVTALLVSCAAPLALGSSRTTPGDTNSPVSSRRPHPWAAEQRPDLGPAAGSPGGGGERIATSSQGPGDK